MIQIKPKRKEMRGCRYCRVAAPCSKLAMAQCVDFRDRKLLQSGREWVRLVTGSQHCVTCQSCQQCQKGLVTTEPPSGSHWWTARQLT